MTHKGFWSACEMIIGPAAVKAEWKRLAGDEYEAAKAFLRPVQRLATTYPCNSCGCYHQVIMHSNDDIAAVCTCTPRNCATFQLSRADIAVYELDKPALYRAVTRALSLKPAEAEVPYARNTAQIGFHQPLHGQRCPVFLTIQIEAECYRNVAFALAAKQAEPFILIAATPDLCPPDCPEILGLRRAAMLFLSDVLVIDDSGKMTASTECADMLRHFQDHISGEHASSMESFFYSHGFRCVSLGGRHFTLTSLQAHVIDILYTAYDSNTPDVGKDYILDEIGSPSSRLRDIFRRNTEAFESLIIPGERRGTYRLKIPHP